MFRAFGLIALLGLITACTPTTTYVIGAFPENVTTDRCFTGGQVFGLEVDVPSRLGQVIAMTQFANTSSGLEPVCRLDFADVSAGSYPIYSGEVYGGNAGLCASIRTADGGHYVSCASAAQVRNAMTQPLFAPGNEIRLTNWSPFAS